MSTNEPMTQEQLDAIQKRMNSVTNGPWAPWLDQDGQPHMQGRLMVGVAAGVIPDGETWVEGPDVNNPVAETYTPEDRTFIAHAREDVPALLAEVHRLRALTTVDDEMVERAAKALYLSDFMRRNNWATEDRARVSLESAKGGQIGGWMSTLEDARAALHVALGTGEEA